MNAPLFWRAKNCGVRDVPSSWCRFGRSLHVFYLLQYLGAAKSEDQIDDVENREGEHLFVRSQFDVRN